MDALPTVLVAGATGGTGRWLLKALIEKGYRPIALVRSLEKSSVFRGLGFDGKIDVRVGDVTEPPTLARAFEGVEVVISSVSTPTSPRFPSHDDVVRCEVDGVRALVHAVKTAGTVKHIVLVSSKKVTRPDEFAYKMLNFMFNGIMMYKLEGENVLRGSGLPYTIVRAGGIVDTTSMPESVPDFERILASQRPRETCECEADDGKNKGKGKGKGLHGCWRYVVEQGDDGDGRNLRADICEFLLATIAARDVTVGCTFEIGMSMGSSEAEYRMGCPRSLLETLRKDESASVQPKRLVSLPKETVSEGDESIPDGLMTQWIEAGKPSVLQWFSV